MKGQQHYLVAEQFADSSVYAYQKWGEADTGNGEIADDDALLAAHWHQRQAQVHATLAAAAALSKLVGLLAGGVGIVDLTEHQPQDLSDDEPVPYRLAEPLVPCNVGPADGGPELCTLPVDHEGPLHEDARKGVKWTRYDLPEYPDVSDGGVPYAPRGNACAAPGLVVGSWCKLPYDQHHMHEDKQGRKWGVVPVDPIYRSTATDMYMEMPR